MSLTINRRQFLQALGLQFTALQLTNSAFAQVTTKQESSVLTSKTLYINKTIPATGQNIQPIGMGTWQTFNVGSDRELRDARTQVLKAFFANGGQLVDSSPMYGSSQAVMGYALSQLKFPKPLFAADKVWTRSDNTIADLTDSLRHWNIPQFELVQIHNLLNWKHHLPALQALKSQGKLKYVGITTSHGRRHDDLEAIMSSEKIDFVQLTYNMTHREVEKRLLPLAQDKGIAVIANRPFDGGYLVKSLKSKNPPLPVWAKDIDCKNWPQFLLKFIVSHPAITCAIPATTQVAHMLENMGAQVGVLPTTAQRNDMLAYLQKVI